MRISRMAMAAVAALIFLLVLIACVGSSGATPEASTRCDPRYIPTAEAAQHIGEEATVCGLVKDYFFSTTGSRPTYILFEQSGAHPIIRGGFRSAELDIPFTVLILGKDKSNFPANFGSFYTGKMICATGLIEKLPQVSGEFSEDNPAIVVQSSSQIDVDCKTQSADR